MTDTPRPPPGDADRSPEAVSARLEEAARVRRSIAETIARVRKLTAGIGDPNAPRATDDPAPPSPSPEPTVIVPAPKTRGADDDDDGGRGLSGDVSALLDRTRRVIERTRHLLDKSRKDSADRQGE